ncbi:hypothetical protein GMORB2_7397 [Geosmithia morbida]|uniref:Vezatin n=1 Tax=Geosmithia morbida TaxID=1094350 RepID=A0A9P5D431_9HYPO|nr:uncharacterized protein GMORB2_7397 [Geosmithia morbida]KAF4122405.1 hypothetical protein GMORB2_7397 [Geosmithia morbida]
MEPIVYEETPLAAYLRAPTDPDAKDGGDGSDGEWTNAIAAEQDAPSTTSSDLSPPASPTPFAPTGRPAVRARFRNNKPNNLPPLNTGRTSSLRLIKKNYSAAVAASIDRVDNAKFLEKFRYTIVASQLLSGHSLLGSHQPPSVLDEVVRSNGSGPEYSPEGMMGMVIGVLAVAVILSWIVGKKPTFVTRKRLIFLICLAAAGVVLAKVYMKRQWLRYRREQALSEVVSFVSVAHEFDAAGGAALSLIQEVELVSRGYRISTPLPPVTRIEDRTQSRKCTRIRKVLRAALADILETHISVSTGVRGFAEQTDLEKYLDIYEISDFDISDASRGFDPEEFEDPESLRTLKILSSRLYTMRKLFLCSLLALDANGESRDLLRWTAAVEALQSLNTSAREAGAKTQGVLSEEESFPPPESQKCPLTPGRERWRSQLHKLNSLGSGIRGLQAKLHLLREESDRALNDSSDLSELAPNLMSQYESIGTDLRELMGAWEEGKAALAQGIDRNEKRLSSMSTLISPMSSPLSGLMTVDEDGNAAAALKALTGGSSAGSESNDEPEREVFEAVALPRQRSTLTREERIARVRDEREQKAQARQNLDNTRGMMKELETVINLHPRSRMSAPAPGRISM